MPHALRCNADNRGRRRGGRSPSADGVGEMGMDAMFAQGDSEHEEDDEEEEEDDDDDEVDSDADEASGAEEAEAGDLYSEDATVDVGGFSKVVVLHCRTTPSAFVTHDFPRSEIPALRSKRLPTSVGFSTHRMFSSVERLGSPGAGAASADDRKIAHPLLPDPSFRPHGHRTRATALHGTCCWLRTGRATDARTLRPVAPAHRAGGGPCSSIDRQVCASSS